MLLVTINVFICISTATPDNGLHSIPGTPTLSNGPAATQHTMTPATTTANGGLHHHSATPTVSFSESNTPTSTTTKSDKKTGKFATLSRIFKPWKWKRRKKPSEKIEKTAVGELRLWTFHKLLCNVWVHYCLSKKTYHQGQKNNFNTKLLLGNYYSGITISNSRGHAGQGVHVAPWILSLKYFT